MPLKVTIYSRSMASKQYWKLTGELEELEDAEEALSLANVDDIIGGPDFFEVRPFLEEIPDDAQELARLRKNSD